MALSISALAEWMELTVGARLEVSRLRKAVVGYECRKPRLQGWEAWRARAKSASSAIKYLEALVVF